MGDCCNLAVHLLIFKMNGATASTEAIYFPNCNCHLVFASLMFSTNSLVFTTVRHQRVLTSVKRAEQAIFGCQSTCSVLIRFKKYIFDY